jgi:hypothetical protein
LPLTLIAKVLGVSLRRELKARERGRSDAVRGYQAEVARWDEQVWSAIRNNLGRLQVDLAGQAELIKVGGFRRRACVRVHDPNPGDLGAPSQWLDIETGRLYDSRFEKVEGRTAYAAWVEPIARRVADIPPRPTLPT